MTAKRSGARARGEVRKGVSIVGLGNWGSSLAVGLKAVGLSPLEAVVRRKSRARGEVRLVSLDEARYDAEILWICVPDSEITQAAERIVARRPDLRGQTVVHSSGALTVEALVAAQRAGARVAGAAPVYSFPTRDPVSLAGVLFAVEGAPAAWRTVAALARKLGGRPFRISSKAKALYHAAATMASPLLVSALHAAVETAKLAGLARGEAEAVVGVLAAATVQNYFEKGSGGSFSGAFARGDARTVELHLGVLLEHPTLHGIYLALARNAAASLPVRNRAELERALEGSSIEERGVRD